MRARHRNSWFFVVAALIGFAYPGLAQPKDPGARLDPGASLKEEGRMIPYLEVRTPNGRYMVRLFGEDDGPVQLPLKDARISSVLLSTELTEKGFRVSLGAEEGEFRVNPAGRYDLAFGEEVVLNELEALGLKNWTAKLTVGEFAPLPDCCSCGVINCCPLEGKCMGCSKCGVCCRDGGRPEV